MPSPSFHLSSPDFFLGWDSDPAKRNVFGLIDANPDLARAGIRLRQFGQTIIEMLGAAKSMPPGLCPVGCDRPSRRRSHLDPRSPARILRHRALALDIFKGLMDGPMQTMKSTSLASSPPCLWGWWASQGEWEHYGGHLRFTDSQGNIVADGLSEDDYQTSSAKRWSPGPT
jgi:NAD-reducing hydrogenase large subunit